MSVNKEKRTSAMGLFKILCTTPDTLNRYQFIGVTSPQSKALIVLSHCYGVQWTFFFRIFEIIIFCFVVAICDLVYAVEAMYSLP